MNVKNEKNIVPQHVAIIMDGNGRWAQKKNLPRFRGHLAGVRRLENLAKFANKVGVQVMTVYAFSTENWRRPPAEVKMLLQTLCTVMETRIGQMMKGNIRLRFIGRREEIPDYVLKSMDRAVARTKDNTGLILNLAFNYGSRTEIIDAVRTMAEDVRDGRLAVTDITEDVLSQRLYTGSLPDPDLLIRTSGEQRISNFLLWQLSYAEFYFTKKFWPDFDEEEFLKALEDFRKRERRYGKISGQES